jgi:hypothetical protein
MCLNMDVRGHTGAKEADAVVNRRRLDGKINGSAGMQANPTTTDWISQSILKWIDRQRHVVFLRDEIAFPLFMQFPCHIKYQR